jgi:hypothetical protein
MNYPLMHAVRLERASELPARYPGVLDAREILAHFRVNWREGAAVIGGVLVMLVTAWLIWAALAEAALAGRGSLG